MGQYQDWLQYQALDRKLRAQLLALETIQAQVQEKLEELRKQLPQAENPLLLALAHYLVQQKRARELAASQGTNPTQSPIPSQNQQISPSYEGARPTPINGLSASDTAHEPLSNAFSNWGSFPGFDPRNIPTTPANQPQAPDANRQGSGTSHSVIPPLFSLPTGQTPFSEKLPKNVTPRLPISDLNNGSGSDSDSLADLEIPDWLQHISVSTDQGYMPIDPESIRTNRLVQRWLTRWGKQTPSQLLPSEDESHE
ncbi:MAG TPA: hypothetical protein VFN23_15700 [Ktedonobacteraceae bacterium]|nr:hypothetical protein [Ktedonobacteraceae bacterium]